MSALLKVKPVLSLSLHEQPLDNTEQIRYITYPSGIDPLGLFNKPYKIMIVH